MRSRCVYGTRIHACPHTHLIAQVCDDGGGAVRTAGERRNRTVLDALGVLRPLHAIQPAEGVAVVAAHQAVPAAHGGGLVAAVGVFTGAGSDGLAHIEDVHQVVAVAGRILAVLLRSLLHQRAEIEAIPGAAIDMTLTRRDEGKKEQMINGINSKDKTHARTVHPTHDKQVNIRGMGLRRNRGETQHNRKYEYS